MLLSLTMCLIVSSAAIWTPKMRSRGFNLYLLGLLFPDFIMNLTVLIISFIELAEDKKIETMSLDACAFGMAMITYNYAVNIWISALICNKVHRILVNSHNAVRSVREDPKKIIKKIIFVNFIACIMSILVYVIAPQFGVNSHENACLNLRTRDSDLFFVIYSIFTYFPILYVCYVTFDVYWRKLLPPPGTSRFIATFFLRTAIVSTIMSTAASVATWHRDETTFKAFQFVVHAQGLIVGAMSMMKPDILKTVSEMCYCAKSVEKSKNSNMNITNGQKTNITLKQSTAVE